MGVTDAFRDLGCRFTDELEIAQGGVIAHGAGVERGLLQPGGIVPDPFAEPGHVLDVEAPPPGSRSLSDKHRLALDVGTQLLAQSAVGHQIDGATQQVFDIEPRAEVAFGCRAPEAGRGLHLWSPAVPRPLCPKDFKRHGSTDPSLALRWHLYLRRREIEVPGRLVDVEIDRVTGGVMVDVQAAGFPSVATLGSAVNSTYGLSISG